jgi:hypothetical protein
MKQLVISLIILVAALLCHAQTDLSVGSIPKNLLTNAKAVVRYYNTEFEIYSISKAEKRVHYAVTILNKNAEDAAAFREGYNKFSKISKIKAALYDEYGKPVKTQERLEVKDICSSLDAGSYNDIRIKYITPDYHNYPYTVEYSYVETYSDAVDYPDWYAFDDYNTAVESSDFKVIFPSGFGLRYIQNPPDLNKIESKPDNKTQSITWEIKSLPARVEENFSPPLYRLSPYVKISPTEISMEGYAGRMDSWEKIGLWVNSLNVERQELSEETRQKVLDLIAGKTTVKEKVNALYQYMQNKTRYVNVSIGIGGLQTRPALDVDKLGYGDCKALSNYMLSLLKVAGIQSFYTLVNAGDNGKDFFPEFPSQQFNHIILCVPDRQDTIWLECTNQEIPCGYLGTFTNDRPVLLVTEKGGILTRTPGWLPVENSRSRNINVTLDNKGNGKAEVITHYLGDYYADQLQILLADAKDQRDQTIEQIRIPVFEMNTYSNKHQQSSKPSITEFLSLNLPDYTSLAGNKQLLRVNMMDRVETNPFSKKTRNSPILFNNSVSLSDSIRFTVPDPTLIKFLPKEVNISKPWGDYTLNIRKTDTGLEVFRSLVIRQGVYEKEHYEEISGFFEEVIKSDDSKVVIGG